MSEKRRVILTNETPNDQGGIIINSSIDWSRFIANPVMLFQHGDDRDLGDIPIGHWEDLQFDGVNWTAIPVFSEVDNDKVKLVKTLYDEGNLKACSIGGACYWKKTNQKDNWGNYITYKNEKGYRESERFITYEASIVSLPSNATALSLSAKCYETEAEILTLNSRFMEEEKKTVEEKPETVELAKKTEDKAESEAEKAEEAKVESKADEPKVEHIILSSDEDLKKEMRLSLFGWMKSFFASENPAKHMKDEPDGDEPIKKADLPTKDLPHGATEKLEAEAKAKEIESALEKVENCKNEADIEEFCNKMGSDLPSVVKDAIEKKKAAYAAEKVKNNSKFLEMPEQKTKAELDAEGVKLADKPEPVLLGGGNRVPEFTTLRSDKEGRGIIDRVLMTGGMSKDKNIQDQINEHKVVLQSIINDPRLQSVVEKITFSDKSGNRSIPMATAKDLLARFESGNIDFMNFRTGKLENMVQLATSDLLASPDLIAAEWLSMFVFAQFPSAAWKSEIPVYGATSPAGNNLGFIWANIAANPAVYQGSRPNNPTDYEYTDTAVAVTLSPFYLQPMLWQPLLMSQLRYDQMGTGWAQAMNVFNTTIDNYLIYTLLTLAASGNVVKTNGSTFTIDAATNPDAFLLNTAFAGNLAAPKLDNLLVIEQIFRKQNYPDGTKFVVIQDPTFERYLTSDEKTQSLLTRFVNSEGNELVSYKNAMLRSRSKVGLYNKATSAVVNPASVLAPTTTVGACLALIPNQAALALAQLDVFMIQDPTKYGYKMSADTRMGAALIRANGNGSAIVTYGDPQN